MVQCPSAQNPYEDGSEPTELENNILRLLEDAGLPTDVNDQIMKLIEGAQHVVQPDHRPKYGALERACREAARHELTIRFAPREISTASGFFVEIDPAHGGDPADAFVNLVHETLS
jgi:hypothetical protein